ncbi:hypothetical protein [Peribacillus asahii]|uniref:hypothetical protein n=1 Tax=Peribacillus asahii TaxID=228899 RepID=UPI002079A7FE|nr:hypothetical protein [Peribacillus asahii]USK72666.1 hypothetical protein LIS76_23370 [Peribacillus asahii]USK72703.1 hypothetical protein LIS76_23950 [Peribacillus asahii]
MITKTDLAVAAFCKNDIKQALKIAKDFKMGLTRVDHKQIVAGYECMIHGDFYKQLNKNPEEETKKAVEVFRERIYLPYMKRKEGN